MTEGAEAEEAPARRSWIRPMAPRDPHESHRALTGHAEIPTWVAGASVAVPVALFILSVWALQIRPLEKGRAIEAAFIVTAGLVLAASPSRWAVLLIGLLLAALVAVMVTIASTRAAIVSASPR